MTDTKNSSPTLMRRRCARAVYSTGLLAFTTLTPRVAAADDSLWETAHVPKFERVSTFEVYRNAPEVEETVAEILAVDALGERIVYTDAASESIGLVDISDPHDPVAAGRLIVDGEPTSVAIVNNHALVAVNTSESFVSPSGHLSVIDLDTLLEVRRIELAGQPDSVAVDKDQRWVAIVIENERDEDVEVDGVEGGLPQTPAGLLQTLKLHDDVDRWSVKSVDLTGLADIAPEDPEPEYVDINRHGIAAVTLQENNHIILVDMKKSRVVGHFSAGTVDLEGVDNVEDGNILPVDSLYDVKREPDTVQWLDDRWIVTANEGDLDGGSRGFTVFQKNGKVRYDSGVDFDHLAISAGHYPDDRSENKGSEPEGVETGKFGRDDLVFVGSERGNFVAVYRSKRNGKRMQLVQVLPGAGIGPEGLLAIPDRGLFVVGNETDDAEDGYRSTISIFSQGESRGIPEYPQIASTTADGYPIGWAALSGLAADPFDPDTLYAVSDSILSPASIFAIDASQKPAMIYDRIVVRDEAGEALDLDLEGITARPRGGFWLAVEGKAGGATPNELIAVDNDGNIEHRATLPPELAEHALQYGFEGVASTWTTIGETVFVAFQRAWPDAGDAGYARIGRYHVASDRWAFYHYPLETTEVGWVGISELVHLGGERFAVLERDNQQQGPAAAIKRVYGIDLNVPARPYPEMPNLLDKTLLYDLMPDLVARNGWVPDKIEGMALRSDGSVTFVGDNDGLDDAVGETPFWTIERWPRPESR